MTNMLTDQDWGILLRRIQDGKCTPFLGAGVNTGILPLGADIARQWAAENNYPLEDSHDLARVAQFLAVIRDDPMYAKEEILRQFKTTAPPNYSRPDEVHAILADLPLPVYITTNYDDFMTQALKSRGKDVCWDLCHWNSLLQNRPSVFDSATGFHPTPTQPVVFHMHGHQDVSESIVLTEDDYLDFLVSISRNRSLLPPRIQEALTGASLLFIGYRLADWDFRVLFRGLVSAMESSLRRINVAVQLLPSVKDVDQEKVQRYLTEYFDDMHVRVFWGTAKDFAVALSKRWKGFRK